MKQRLTIAAMLAAVAGVGVIAYASVTRPAHVRATAPFVSAQGSNYPYGAENGNDIWESTGTTTIQYAPITLAVASSPGTVITGTAGKKIRVLGVFMTNVTAGGTATFQTSTGPVGLTGAMVAAANGQISLPNNKFGYFETATGDNLLLVETGTSNILSGYVVYCLY